MHESAASRRQSLELSGYAVHHKFDDRRTKRVLYENANKLRQIEPLAIANTALKVNIPEHISSELLKYHWCWIHPLFIFVYRPAFTKGMSLVDTQDPNAPDPPYFSQTLLTVMHAHCARFLNHDVYQPQHTDVGSPHMGASLTMTASEFMHKLTIEAQLGLGMETTKPSSIPAIQALLQQSAREVVFDRSSQAWLYGGMACKYLPVKTILNPVHTPFKRILTCF